jgi:hypothetical protein
MLNALSRPQLMPGVFSIRCAQQYARITELMFFPKQRSSAKDHSDDAM